MRHALVLIALLTTSCSKEFAVREGGAIDPVAFNLVQPIKMVCQTVPSMCDEPPVLVAADAPRYPAAALANGQSGQAEVHIFIDTSGSTADAKLLSATAPEFGNAAMTAVKSWRFQPARKAGVAVPIDGKIIFPFVVH